MHALNQIVKNSLASKPKLSDLEPVPAKVRPKVRLDQLLFERGLAESRSQAQAIILAGEVSNAQGQRYEKPGQKLPPETELILKQKPRFVSRAGHKLEAALDQFQLNPTGLTCLDVGASTGGFTDCLLQRGAAQVFALDVGTNQLAYKLRQDPRVISQEQFNCRNLTRAELDHTPIDLGVTDVSFISLTLILPPMLSTIKAGGWLIALIKPQFEAPREAIGKGGIVREDSVRQACIEKIRQHTLTQNAHWQGSIPSPIQGSDGNQEYLALIQKAAI